MASARPGLAPAIGAMLRLSALVWDLGLISYVLIPLNGEPWYPRRLSEVGADTAVIYLLIYYLIYVLFFYHYYSFVYSPLSSHVSFLGEGWLQNHDACNHHRFADILCFWSWWWMDGWIKFLNLIIMRIYSCQHKVITYIAYIPWNISTQDNDRVLIICPSAGVSLFLLPNSQVWVRNEY